MPHSHSTFSNANDSNIESKCVKTTHTFSSYSSEPSSRYPEARLHGSDTPCSSQCLLKHIPVTLIVTVTDAHRRTGTRSFSMTVNAPTPVSTLTIAEIDDITVKISAVQTNNPITPIQVSASGGQTPYSYSMSSNPATGAGLSINQNSGQITGTPTQRGTFTLSVTVTDNASTTANEGFSMAVRLIGDFNGDGAVNESDFSLFVEVFGLTEDDDGFNAEMDLNGDGTIDVADFLIFVSHFPGSVTRFF